MATVTIVLAILGCIFGLLGFVAAAVTSVIVIAWKNSTHQIQYVDPGKTVVEPDAPQHILDQLPTPPEPQTLEQYYRQLARDRGELEDF